MSAWTAMDRGTRVVILLLGGALVAGLGYLGWQVYRPAAVTETAAAAPEPQPSAPTATQPEAEPKVEAATALPEASEAPAAEPAAEPPAAPAMPVIDTWRVAVDGEAVVSGTAEPGATVEVLVDGKVVATGAAGGTGDFALLFTLAPNPRPSLMWLSMTLAGQPAIPSAQMVALGPIAGPEPEPAPAATVAADPAAPPEALASAETDPPAALLLSEDGAVVLEDSQPPPRSRCRA